jgi:ribosomal protein S18 acetylase RimI-like enzyme
MTTASGLTAFPIQADTAFNTPALLTERGFRLRAARDTDITWLRDLYASTRSDEMAAVPWPDNVKRSFLDQQFALQHTHYLAHYGSADFMVLENKAGSAGRYYLQRNERDYLIVDISLFPALRGKGVGSLLIQHTQNQARSEQRDVCLHVQQFNSGAQKLYARLGFKVENAENSYISMRWRWN